MSQTMPRHRLMTYAVLIRLCTMTTMLLLLLVWFLNAHRLTCSWVLLVHLIITCVLLMAGMEHALLHRRAMVSAYMRREAPVLRTLYGRGFLLVQQVLLSALLAFALMAAALQFVPRQWSLLVADLLLMTLLLPWLSRSAGGLVRGDYRFAMARHWGMWISVVLIWVEYMLALLYAPPAAYLGMRWQEVVLYGYSAPDVGCEPIRTFANVIATAQALSLWAAQNYARAMTDPTQATVLWVGLLILVLFPFVVAYAFSRALVGVMARPWEMWTSMVEDFRQPGGRSEPASNDESAPFDERRS